MHKHIFFSLCIISFWYFTVVIKMVKLILERICYASVLGILKNIPAVSTPSSVSDCQQG